MDISAWKWLSSLITRTLPILENINPVFDSMTTILTVNNTNKSQLLEWLAPYLISIFHNRVLLSIRLYDFANRFRDYRGMPTFKKFELQSRDGNIWDYGLCCHHEWGICNYCQMIRGRIENRQVFDRNLRTVKLHTGIIIKIHMTPWLNRLWYSYFWRKIFISRVFNGKELSAKGRRIP